MTVALNSLLGELREYAKDWSARAASKEPVDRAIAEIERLRGALRIAREGYASEAITGLPVLQSWRERTLSVIDAAMNSDKLPNAGGKPT